MNVIITALNDSDKVVSINLQHLRVAFESQVFLFPEYLPNAVVLKVENKAITKLATVIATKASDTVLVEDCNCRVVSLRDLLWFKDDLPWLACIDFQRLHRAFVVTECFEASENVDIVAQAA